MAKHESVPWQLRSLALACCLFGVFGWASCTIQAAGSSDFKELEIRETENWDFVEGSWESSAEGILSPPRRPADENLAFYTAAAFADFEAEFQFRWEIQNAGAGFIFRAKDAQHYYLAHFPCTGQQYRAEHFWAAISKVDESGWVRVLSMQMVHGVPSEIGVWHKIRLVVNGSEFRLWVDGRPLTAVRDDSYSQPGHVGLESYNGRDPNRLTPEVGDPVLRTGAGSSFRGLRLRGQSVPTQGWNPDIVPTRPWFYPLADSSYGKWQYASSLCKAPNGDILMKLSVAREHLDSDSVAVLLRSTDKGRSWSAPQKLPERLKRGSFHNTQDGRLNMHFVESEPPFRVLISHSRDSGHSWSSFKEVGRLDFAEGLGVQNAYVGRVLELSNGTLLRFGYAVGANQSVHGAIREKGGVRYWGPITEADFSFCIRSTDGGAHWSKPVDLNGSNPRPHYFMVAKETGSEVSAAETRDGRIVALIRSYTSPWMWETWSQDAGKTWSPAARGPFPMYAATNAMSSSASGALLIAGRHPGVAVQLSRDNGMTWQCTRIDTPFYANGVTCEVEPNVILYIYDGKYSDPRVRAQLIRVAPDRLVPELVPK